MAFTPEKFLKRLRPLSFSFDKGITLKASYIGRNVRLVAPENSKILLTKTTVGRNTTILAKRGSKIKMDEVQLGEGCQIHANYGITIGKKNPIC